MEFWNKLKQQLSQLHQPANTPDVLRQGPQPYPVIGRDLTLDQLANGNSDYIYPSPSASGLLDLPSYQNRLEALAQRMNHPELADGTVQKTPVITPEQIQAGVDWLMTKTRNWRSVISFSWPGQAIFRLAPMIPLLHGSVTAANYPAGQQTNGQLIGAGPTLVFYPQGLAPTEVIYPTAA